jgi:hypothetical protein
MAQNDSDKSDKSPSDKSPGAEINKPDARASAAQPRRPAAPPLSQLQRAAETPPGGGEKAPEEAAANVAPAKKSGLRLGWIALGLIVVAAGAIAGAFALRDTNRELRAFTDAIENAAQEPLAALNDFKEKALGAFEGKKPSHRPAGVAVKEPAPVAEAPKELAPVADTAKEPAPISEPPREPAPPAGAPAEAAHEEPAPAATLPPKRPAEISPAPEERPREAAAPKEERDTLLKRVEDIEKLAQSAMKSAEEARAARTEGAEKPAADAGAISERDYITALEGRIDELAGEIKAVREKLEGAKSELRAPQESAEAKKQPEKKSSAAELVVVAQSLNQEIEKGRPYSVELAALASLGADPELLAALAPAAEKGTMTHEQLLHGFEPVAKRLYVVDAPKSTGSYLDRVTQAFARLVRVHPVGEQPSASITDRVEEIRSALKRGDVAGATAAFELLPDSARTEESAFGELLRQRRDAEKASAALLSGAISALGRNKS